ncbi:hypothetical protein XENOCAPTIV_030274 [Xenoophorus captivus]|uniref:Uncharacterized protein n=1 Tax=Xenoophorus captivus TaxID=1517983 RepID=A0ABV0RMZ0_9TELE
MLRGWGASVGSELLSSSLFQAGSFLCAVAASLLSGQLVLTFLSLQSVIFSRPYLCSLTSITIAFLAGRSPHSFCGMGLISDGSACHFSVKMLYVWSLQRHA